MAPKSEPTTIQIQDEETEDEAKHSVAVEKPDVKERADADGVSRN